MPKLTNLGKPVSNKEADIVDVALGLFAGKGIDKTSMNDIATAVGIRKASLYYYYSSKEAIVDAIIDSSRFKAVDVSNLLSDNTISLEDRLVKCGRTFLQGMKQRPQYQAMTRRESAIHETIGWRIKLRQQMKQHIETRIAALARILENDLQNLDRSTANILASQFFHSLTYFFAFEYDTRMKPPGTRKINRYVQVQVDSLMGYYNVKISGNN
jgi:AcrR family transcriptional regulator